MECEECPNSKMVDGRHIRECTGTGVCPCAPANCKECKYYEAFSFFLDCWYCSCFDTHHNLKRTNADYCKSFKPIVPYVIEYKFDVRKKETPEDFMEVKR